MRVLRIADLPDGPLEAAAVFYADLPPPWGRGTILNSFQDGGEAPASTPDLESARGEVGSTGGCPSPTTWVLSPEGEDGWVPSPAGEDVAIVFPSADHTHRAWRLAAVQTLARGLAPLRVNALASDDPAVIESALAYLEAAPGLTGQYLPLDSLGASDVLTSIA